MQIDVRRFYSHPVIAVILHRLFIVSFSFAGILMLMAAGWIKRGFVMPSLASWLQHVVPDPASYVFTVPLAFLIWLHVAENARRFPLYFSKPAFLISLCGFAGATWFTAVTTIRFSAYYANTLAVYGAVAGLFVFVRFKDCWEYAVSNRKRTLVAFFAAGIGAFYNLTDEKLWHHICHSSALAAYWMLKPLGLKLGVEITNVPGYPGNPAIQLASHYFTIDVLRACSGMEGISMFFFFLSVLIILDWPLFKRMLLLEVYMIGFIYIFLVNSLRIATLFAIGYFSFKPDASPFVHSLQGEPFEIFHSMMGVVYYSITFAVFALCFYKIAATSRMAEASA